MTMQADTDTTSPKHLRDKYAIVGVGETTYTRGSGITTRALGTWAVRNAIADAGLKAADIDGMLSYQSGDSTFAPLIAGDLGILHRLALRHLRPVAGGDVIGRLHHFTRSGRPATISTTSSATEATAWFSRPAASRKRRASAFSGTIPSPTSFATATQ